MAAVTVCGDFGAQENKVCPCFRFFFFFVPSICHEVMGLDVMILAFWMLSFKPAFSLSSFTFLKSQTERLADRLRDGQPDDITKLLTDLHG